MLEQRLRELVRSGSTLLFLEGSSTERVLKVRLGAGKLIVKLANDTTRMIVFQRYAVTAVGLQFWTEAGRPCVLYRWEQVPASHFGGSDDPGPPDIAA